MSSEPARYRRTSAARLGVLAAAEPSGAISASGPATSAQLRNQGNTQAAQAEVELARRELQRVSLTLRDQTSNVYRDYENAKIIADRYGAEILPRARKAYELTLRRYGLTLASFTSVLNVQRMLFRLEIDYIAALETSKINAVMVDGLLLGGGLEMPLRADFVERDLRMP